MNEINQTTLEGLGLARQSLSSKSNLGQDDFLELMVTQIQNQDPFKPLESGDFLGQMAQFSTVTGIQDLQNSFSGVANALISNQALQASSLIGRTIFFESDVAEYYSENDVLGAAKIDQKIENFVVNITDMNGQHLRRIEYGPQTQGVKQITWDGITDNGDEVLPGKYKIQVIDSSNDTPRSLETYAAAQVNSVTLGEHGQGITLNAGVLGDIDFLNVKQIK